MTRAFMIGELTNGQNSYTYNPGWFHSNPSRADVAKWISTRYSNVPLQKWWKHIVLDKTQSADDSYSWDDASVRIKGDWVYGIPTRADPSPGRYMKWKKEAFNKKVSWYGQSSPLDWWAEQYSHYYRTEKTGGGLIDDTTTGSTRPPMRRRNEELREKIIACEAGFSDLALEALFPNSIRRRSARSRGSPA